ncbi:MAG: hypothetical protein PF448_05505 [Bacteroidales bacterium]|jgi:hypothetical protein|nr:hypothetical protein [Bacteroidales bacterium]
MKNIVILLLILISPIFVLSQEAVNQKSCLELTKFFDPDFPDKSQTRDIHPAAMKNYIADGYYYPIEIINQRRQSDKLKLQVSSEFERELEMWYVEHPFFPQPFSIENPVEDKRTFLKARAMWIKYNPQKYQQLSQIIYSDTILRRDFSFVVE